MAPDATPIPGLTALVVEDDNQLQLVYSKLLVRAGFTVTTARDGIAAIEAFKKETPKLLIIDFLLPRMDGLQVLEKIMPIKKVPTIFVSAVMRDASVTARLRGLGVQWILEKPFRVEVMRKAFADAVAMAQASLKDAPKS